MHLGEEGRLVGHVLGALDRDHHVEGVRRQTVLAPVAQQIDRVGRRGIEVPGVGVLGRRDGQGGHHGAIFAREHPRRAAVAAADITDEVARGDLGALGDQGDELADRDLRALASRTPEPMMDVFTPDLAVEAVEVVVVGGDRSGDRLRQWE